jgi:predicted aspartyl protease
VNFTKRDSLLIHAGATGQIVLPRAVFDAADEKTEVVAHMRDDKSNVAVATLSASQEGRSPPEPWAWPGGS